MTHLQRETDRLKRKILALGALVEDNLRLAFQAIEARDADKAHRVMVTDILVDDQEVEVEEECLKILALYQPVASDLRFLVAVIKINSELERIGDLASNIGERAISLAQEHPVIGFAVDRGVGAVEIHSEHNITAQLHVCKEHIDIISGYTFAAKYSYYVGYPLLTKKH